MKPFYRFPLEYRQEALAEGRVFAWGKITKHVRTWLMVSIPVGGEVWSGWRVFKRHEKHVSIERVQL